jgi:2-pyrone-4,6-dicarboxylate lactonase
MRPCLAPDSNPHPPRITAPAGTCDTHCHVIGPQSRYPFSEPRSYTPPDSPVEAYRRLRETLGIARSVIVQPGAHGFDNTVTTDAIAALGDSARGIAVVPPDISEEDLAELDAKGIRGLRLSTLLTGGVGTDNIVRMAEKIAPLGWHLVVHFEADRLETLAPVLKRIPLTMVIDHMGRVDASRGLDQAAFRLLQDLMEDERFWVKVSGCERISRAGPPFHDAVPFARGLVERFPDRTLWGTDFPHPNIKRFMPNDGELVDLLPLIAPTPALMQSLLVDNPTKLYFTD